MLEAEFCRGESGECSRRAELPIPCPFGYLPVTSLTFEVIHVASYCR